MNEKKDSLLNNLLGRHLPFKERVFRMILLIAGFVDLFALVETLAIAGFVWMALPLVILLVAVVVALVLIVIFQKHKIAEIIFDFVMIVLVFPNMFFFNGGIHSGAPLWFVISMIYTFLMFTGIKFAIFMALNIVIDVSVYIFAYNNPEIITPLSSLFSEYADSLFGVILVGLAAGIMLKFQMHLYEEEREIVEKQKMQLENMNQSKDRFFANMSREIITPLNTLMGFNEMILRENPNGTTNTYARGVKDASKLLLGLVNDILDVSQLETKKLEIREEDYSTLLLIQDITHKMEILLQDKDVEFYCDVDDDVPAVMKGDAKRILQVLTNLLMNAVKYTQEGFITLHFSVSKRYQNIVQIVFRVEDTGIGIRKEEIDSIFDIYKRVESSTTNSAQGAGLGLSISKQLVELMHGEILVDSIYTKGTVFTVVLEQTVVDDSPIRQIERMYKQRQLLPKEYKQRFEAPEARILVVDDNRMDVNTICKLLSATRIQIDNVISFEECLRMTKKRYYHAILMDDMMTGIGLIEAVREVQRQENGLCRSTAMIVMTANLTQQLEKKYQDGGFDCVIEKPFDGSILEETILTFLPDDSVEYQSFEVLKNDGIPRKRPVGRRKKRVIISTDSVADIPDEYMDKYEIKMMYLYIRTSNGRFVDIKEINTDCLDNFSQDEISMAYTDNVSIEEYEAFFIEQLDIAEQVVHISMASDIGKSHSVVIDAAKGLGHVHVVDAGHISCGQSLLVLYAAWMAQSGASVEEICRETKTMVKRVECGFIIPSATQFYRNGYANPLVVNISKIFRMRPILSMKKGAIEITSFGVGTMDHARKRYIQKRLCKKKNINTDIVVISYVGLTDAQLQMVIDEIERYVKFDHVIIQKASFTFACHVGSEAFGFAFFRD